MKLRSVNFVQGVQLPGNGGAVERFLETTRNKFSVSLDYADGFVTIGRPGKGRILVPLVNVQCLEPDDDVAPSTVKK